MKMLVWAGLVLSTFLVFGAAPAVAATVPLPNCMNYPSVYTPCQGSVFVDPATGNPLALISGGVPVAIVSGGGGGGGSDPNNASFSTAVGPLVAATDYSAQAFRALNITCSSAGSANLTLTGSGVLPYTFVSGPSYQIGFAVKSIDAIPSGCVLYGVK